MSNIFSRRSDAGEAEPNELSEIRASRSSSGLPVKDLSNTNPTNVGLDWDSSDLISLANKDNIFYYPEPRGLYRAREAISDHFASYKRNMPPDNYFLCASTSEGYSWLFKLLCDTGDAVLVPKPGYPLFQHLAELESVQVLTYKLEYVHPSGWYLNLDELSFILSEDHGRRIKAIVVINPSNPTGSYIRKGERTAILDLCEKYDLALIADEVFFDFPIDENVERKTFVGEDRVLTFALDGLSKRMGLPQLKLAWITISGPSQKVSRAKKRLDLIADTFLSVNSPIMNALPFLFEHETAFLCKSLGRIRQNYAVYLEILTGKASPHRVLCCQGGWTALIESPSYFEEDKIAQRFLEEKGIFAQPGYFFDIDNGVHFAFSLIIPAISACCWCMEYRDFFEVLENS
ncbi:MAG TPA: pyridoxal phosphate-dependent aminotransferase [Rectinema sp.]|nr:pyridoxal phosphate-dependent aminotransferase [Rectinema sp.]HQQ72905.1 pyridoxal phosphate-dependent aminotransferase [Rectinema sp.]